MAQACAIPRASHGLLEDDAPWQTLAPRTTPLTAPGFAVRTKTLPSGLRLAVEEAETHGLVGAILSFGVGSKHDPHGKEGLAHFVEHLMFRMPVAPGQTFHEGLRALGAGALNGSTSPDLTQYQAFVAVEHLRPLLELYAKLFTQPLAGVTDEVARGEQQVLHSEEQHRDEFGILGKLSGFLHQSLFPPEHAYSRPMGGTHVSIARLARADADALSRQHYRPENATLYLVGPLSEDLDAVAAMLPEVLRGSGGNVAPQMVQTAQLPKELPPRPDRGAIFTQARKPGFLMSWRLPPLSGEEGGLVTIATSRTSMSLLESTVDELGIQSATSCWAQHLVQATVLTCWVSIPGAENLAEAASAAAQAPLILWFPQQQSSYAFQDRVYERAMVQEYTPAELFASMRMRATVNAVFGAERFVERAEEASMLFHLTGRGDVLKKRFADAISAKNSEFFGFVKTYLNANEARFVIAEPDSEGAKERVVEPPVPRFGDAPPTSKHSVSKAGLAQMPMPKEFENARQFQLENGLTVVIAPRPQFPVVSVGLGFRGGEAAANVPGAVKFLREVQDHLGPSLYVKAPAQFLHPLYLWKSDSENMTVDVVRAGKGLVANALFVLADRLKTIDTLDWRRVFEYIEREQSGSAHREWEQNRPGSSPRPRSRVRLSPLQRAQTKVAAELYGGAIRDEQAQAEQAEPDEHSEAAFNWENVSGHLAAMHHPKNAILVIVGDVKTDETEGLVRQWFGGWKPEGRYRELAPAASEAPRSGAAQERLITVSANKAEHTDIMLACRLPQEDARTRTIHYALSQVIQHRLFLALREQSGLTYAPSAGTYGSTDGAAHLAVELQVPLGRTKAAVEALRSLWRQFDETGFDESTLSVVRWEQAAKNKLRFQTTDGSVMAILDALNRNLPYDFEARASERLAHIEPKDLAAAFETCRATTVLALVGRDDVIEDVRGGGSQLQSARHAPTDDR